MRKLVFATAALAASISLAQAASSEAVHVGGYTYQWGYVPNGFTVNPYNGDIWPQYQLSPLPRPIYRNSYGQTCDAQGYFCH